MARTNSYNVHVRYPGARLREHYYGSDDNWYSAYYIGDNEPLPEDKGRFMYEDTIVVRNYALQKYTVIPQLETNPIDFIVQRTINGEGVVLYRRLYTTRTDTNDYHKDWSDERVAQEREKARERSRRRRENMDEEEKIQQRLKHREYQRRKSGYYTEKNRTNPRSIGQRARYKNGRFKKKADMTPLDAEFPFKLGDGCLIDMDGNRIELYDKDAIQMAILAFAQKKKEANDTATSRM